MLKMLQEKVPDMNIKDLLQSKNKLFAYEFFHHAVINSTSGATYCFHHKAFSSKLVNLEVQKRFLTLFQSLPISPVIELFAMLYQ